MMLCTVVLYHRGTSMKREEEEEERKRSKRIDLDQFDLVWALSLS